MGNGKLPPIKRKKPPGKLAPATLINAGTPLFAPAPFALLPSRSANLAPWVPSPFAHDHDEMLTPEKLGAPRAAMQTIASSDVELTAEQTRYWYRASTGVLGHKGGIQSSTAVDLAIAGGPRTGLVGPLELDLPPREVSLYPVQISYRRDIDYLDPQGHAIRVTVAVSLGMEHDRWERQTGGIRIGGQPDFHDLMHLTADAGTAHVFVEGNGPDSSAYFGSVIVEGSDNITLAAMLPALEVQITGAKSPLVYKAVPALVQPHAAAWEQYESINDMVRSFDAAHREQAEVDAEAERERNKKHYNPAERAGLAMLGAVVSVAEGFKESVLSIADFSRLLFLRFPGWATGLYDYTPKMWSKAGQAAEGGATSGDIARGMVQSVVDTPKRWAEAAKNDDPYQFGKESMSLYMIGRSGVAAVRGTAGLAFNAGVRQLPRFGTWGFRAAAFIRNKQIAWRVPAATRGMVFPRGMKPTYEYEPTLHIDRPTMMARYVAARNTVEISEAAFMPKWKFMVPDLPPGSLRMRVGNFLRGGTLDRAIRHESQHAFQRVFDPMHPQWTVDAPSYFQNPLEFTQAGSRLPGAWNAHLDAPPGPFARAAGGLIQAPAVLDRDPRPAPPVPQPSEQDTQNALAVIQHARRIQTVEDLEKHAGDKPLLLVLAGNGRILVGPDAIESGAWFVFGDENSQCVVPAFVLDQVKDR